MKYVPISETETFQVTPTCKVYEYGGNDSIDGAIAEISGRYPTSGWALNTMCSEMIFVLEGDGAIVTETAEHPLTKDTMILINPNERYFFNGKGRFILATTPPWRPEQHENVAD